MRGCGLANHKRDTPDRGDDATVLDWQCYWLREYGVQGVVLEGDRGVRRGTEEDDGIWVRCQGKGASVESVRRDVREGLRKGGKVVRLHHTVSILIGVLEGL